MIRNEISRLTSEETLCPALERRELRQTAHFQQFMVAGDNGPSMNIPAGLNSLQDMLSALYEPNSTLMQDQCYHAPAQ